MHACIGQNRHARHSPVHTACETLQEFIARCVKLTTSMCMKFTMEATVPDLSHECTPSYRSCSRWPTLADDKGHENATVACHMMVHVASVHEVELFSL